MPMSPLVKTAKPKIDRENSLELSGELSQSGGYDDDSSDLDLPPGRINALKGREQRLSGLNRPRRNDSSASPRSSRSPSMREKATYATTTGESNSSISSLDDIVDQDILLDKQGFCELDLSAEQRKMHNSRECINLPPLNERMTEDTLEDVHAFSEVSLRSASIASSRANSIVGSCGGKLEALDECEEEENVDDLSDIDEEEPGQIIVTNMENLRLQQHSRRTGESSEVGESPTLPTA